MKRVTKEHEALARIVARLMFKACAKAEGFYQVPNQHPDWSVNNEAVVNAALFEWAQLPEVK